MVLFSMLVAGLTATRPAGSWPLLLHGVLGSALVIVGAVALNQRLERRSDAVMPRTASRPLPSGRLTQGQVSWFAALTSLSGLLYLGLMVNRTTLLLAAVSWLLYVWIYTPMKAISVWQTPIGAVAGAMPTLLGGAAVGVPTDPTVLVLFGILFFWQFPHSMAIAWLYRGEFADARVRVATVVDPSGQLAAWLSVVGAAALVPVTLVPLLYGSSGWGYAIPAVAAGAVYLAASIAFLRRIEDRWARTLLRVSLVYLVVVLGALMC